MNLLPLLAFACLSAATLLAPAVRADDVTVENDALLLGVARTPAPHIHRLVHKASGNSVVSDPASKDLFLLIIPDASGKSQYIGSSSAKMSSLNTLPIDGGTQLRMTYSDFPLPDLAAEVTAICSKDLPTTRWSISVSNQSGRRITSIQFPVVGAVGQIQDPGDDIIVLPDLPGTLIENPAESWRPGQAVYLEYPGNLSSQFIAFQDRTAGVYLASMDAGLHPLTLAIRKQESGFVLHHQFDALPENQGQWQCPYPIAIGVTQGTWCDSADMYKRWAVQQPWCAQTLAERQDVPDWWKAGPDVHVCEVRTYDRRRVCNGSYYSKLLDHLRFLKQHTDANVVCMLAGWENHRRWTAGDYFPVFDQDNARQIIAQMTMEGFRPFFYLSGLYYTFQNEGVDGSEILDADQFVDHFVVDQETGKPKVFTLDESSSTGTWKRHSYQFCPADPFTKEFFHRVVDQAHELGVDVLQMDQTVSGGSDPCYSTDHGHSPGPGPYQAQAFRDLVQDIRDYGKRKTKDFVLFHEEPHEQLIPCVDGFHVREYYEKQWYRGHPGAVGIPLFSYLYHEYAIGYGGDSANIGNFNNAWLVRCHAVNLVTGRTPGGAVWSSPQNLFNAHPDQLTVLRNHCRLLATRAKSYLMLGTMLHPYELDVPQLTISQRQGLFRKNEFHFPSILTSSWLSPEGNVGHLFINISESAQALAVDFDTRNAPAFDRCNVDLYSSQRGDTFVRLWTDSQLPRRFEASVEPLEVLFIEIRRSNTQQ